MSIKVHIKDAGSGSEVKVSSRGQLITAPLDFSTFFQVTLGDVNTAVNIIPPIAGKRFVITAMVFYPSRNVGVNDATVEIYEASADDTITVDTSIFLQEIARQTSSPPLTNLNIIVSEGKWVNAKTDDDDVFVNMAGYYVDA